MNYTELILGILTFLGGCGWAIDRKKHRQIIAGLEAENKQKYMDLARVYVDEYTKNIVRPLEGRVNELTNEVKELKNELETLKKCACYRAACPKRISLLNKSHGAVRCKK